MNKPTLTKALAALLAAGALAACSPKFDWRDFRSTDAPYTIMLPGKAATHTRAVNLDGQEVKMTMSAAEVDGTMFAVGTAELPDAAKAAQAVQAMKLAMVRNIGGTITKEGTKDGAFEVEARGVAPNGAPWPCMAVSWRRINASIRSSCWGTRNILMRIRLIHS